MWLTCGCISCFCGFDMALICVLPLSGSITRPLNSTLLYAAAAAAAAAALWKTLDMYVPVMLSLLLLALSFATAAAAATATHMGKEMMHHSPPHSPNYNLINTFLISTLFPFTHHCRMCVLYMRSAVCACLFICSFVHLLLRFACFQSCRIHITIQWYKMRVTGCERHINSQECEWRCTAKRERKTERKAFVWILIYEK